MVCMDSAGNGNYVIKLSDAVVPKIHQKMKSDNKLEGLF